MEHGVPAQPRQRLVRRGPDVLEEPLLAVVIEQSLQGNSRGSSVPTLRPGTALATPRPPGRPHFCPASPAAPIVPPPGRDGAGAHLLHLSVHGCYTTPLRGGSGRVRTAPRHWLGWEGGGRDTGRKTRGRRRGGSLRGEPEGAGGAAPAHPGDPCRPAGGRAGGCASGALAAGVLNGGKLWECGYFLAFLS